MTAVYLKAPTRPRVVLVHKRSVFENLVEGSDDDHIRALVEAGAAPIAGLKASHQRHAQATAHVARTFAAMPHLTLDVIGRERLPDHTLDDVDLVVVVGGDGTILDASHYLRHQPLLAINSDPLSSVGFLCAGTHEDAAQLLEAYLDNALAIQPLTRLCVNVNGERRGPLVLNDVLVAHACPAATSRYRLRDRSREEVHTSSGLWVSTAAGSTAAMSSAGGEVMALTDTRLQYRVREPYQAPGHKPLALTSGWLAPDEALTLTTKMDDAAVYFDGPHISTPLRLGDHVSIQHANMPLRHLGHPHS